MKIEVVGLGCPRCKQFHEITTHAAADAGRTDEVIYNTDPARIGELGVMSNPVLAIDGEPVFVGEVPDKQEIIQAINDRSGV